MRLKILIYNSQSLGEILLENLEIKLFRLTLMYISLVYFVMNKEPAWVYKVVVCVIYR